MIFTKSNELKQISQELNLAFEVQDWGIINSSAERVLEFIDYFENKTISPNNKYEIFELIIASYNDTLVYNLDKDEIRIRFIDFLNQNKKFIIFKPIIDYWISIIGDDYPVGKILYAVYHGSFPVRLKVSE